MDLFEGKKVIITGGASGIGRAVSQELARRGARLVLADRNTSLLDETVQALIDSGYQAKGAVLDVTDHEAVMKLVEDTASEAGHLDYIFNNAGIAIFGEAHDLSYNDWKRVVDTNLYGVINGVVAAYPLMVRQGFGHIVNTASLAGLVPATGEISYTASKYGVVGLSNSLRVEGKRYGVKVSVVCPGFIRTPIYENIGTVKLDHGKLMQDGPKGASVEKCARAILEGVERNKAIILVTPLAHISWILQRISPPLTRGLMGLFIRQIIRKCRIED